jgi:hypothetical protein
MAKYSVADLRKEYEQVMSYHEANNGYFPVAYESLRASISMYNMSVQYYLGADAYQALMKAYYAWQSPYAGGGWAEHAKGNPKPNCNKFCEQCN